MQTFKKFYISVIYVFLTLKTYSESCQNLNPEQQTKFKQLLTDSQNTFSQSSHDLGRTSLVEYKIDLMPGTRPIKQAPYRLPLAKRQDTENHF